MDDRIRQRREAGAKFKRACDARAPLSILDPEFNFREIAKQMLLLEDHLLHENKHCPDCIRKHLMTIEAFAEEAVSLDKRDRWVPLAKSLVGFARRWLQQVEDHPRAWGRIAQSIRQVRKVLVEQFHDPRGPQRIAAAHIARHTHNH